MNSLFLDNISVSSSVPTLEPSSPSTDASLSSPGAPNTPLSFSDSDDDVIIVTDRTKLDLDSASARLRQLGRFSFVLDICPTADRSARLFLHFHVADANFRNDGQGSNAQDEEMRTFRISWRWLRGLLYADDKLFWVATPADLDPAIVPQSEQRFVSQLDGTFTRCALDVHDLGNAGAPPRDCPHTRASGPPQETAQPTPRAPGPFVPLLPFSAASVAISVGFSSGERAFRRFYVGAGQERVTLSPNWLSTEKLVEFANIPIQNAHTPAWVKEHCSEWRVKEVITCNGGNLCGIDYKLRLLDNQVIWLRDDCLEWVNGALDAVRKFWADGHCLRPDIAEKFLHQRPTAYCSLEWDAALLEWATRKVQTGHAYRMVNGRARTAA